MAIKLVPKFTIAGVIADVSKRVSRLENVFVDRLQQIGEQFVTNARELHTYTDHTSNLRSSIGYIIYKDGKPYDENFKQAEGGTDGTAGINQGKAVAGQVTVPKKGFCLVVVAGMNYALYVEAKNYDVITGSSFEAEKELKRSIELIKKNLK